MKTNLLLLLVASGLAIAVCYTPREISISRVRARTFNFIAPRPRPPLSSADSLSPIHEIIQTAIARSLAQKGLIKVGSGGDVTIAYLIITGDNPATTSIKDYFEIRDDDSALNDRALKTYPRGKNSNYFEAGTLVIYLLDSKNSALLSRRHGSRPMLQNPTANASVDRVQKVVDEILNDLHVEP